MLPPFHPNRALRALALAASAVVAGMAAIALVRGISQEPLEIFHPPAEYAALLVADPPTLRAVFGLDDLFIVLYASLFLLQALWLLRRGVPALLVSAFLALLLGAALLDFVENFHILALLAVAERGLEVPVADISFQASLSTLKFHLSYLGLFVLGICFPRESFAERLLAASLIFVQLPIGILAHVAPRSIVPGLVLARLGFFLAGLLLFAKVCGPERAAPATPAPVPLQP
jgi:hypothetical protein